MKFDRYVISWLLEGDCWQVHRDLLESPTVLINSEREKITQEGWGKKLLDLQDPKGTWAKALYSPKWISTTYTMLLLLRFGTLINNNIEKACVILLDKGFYKDGGINYFKSMDHSETCVTGMILSICSNFHIDDQRLDSLAEHLVNQQMEDGGWNCESYNGAKHSSFHTTISVLEGLLGYEQFRGFDKKITKVRNDAMEFLLEHSLFRSHRTGEIFDQRMMRFSFPPRWRYDILRCLNYACDVRCSKDERFSEAIELVKKKQGKDGRWKLQNRHPGRTYFEMEKPGKPSRWNTLRALRVLKWWNE